MANHLCLLVFALGLLEKLHAFYDMSPRKQNASLGIMHTS